MKLDYKFYDFCPHLLVPSQWGVLLKEHCEMQDMTAEISPNFYLSVLGSISLSAQEKNNILIQVNSLTNTQVSQLEEVFAEELVNLGSYFDNERAHLTQVLCHNLFHATTILRLYGVILTPRDENKILKKIINQWLENSNECLQYLQPYQDIGDSVIKQVFRYYDSK